MAGWPAARLWEVTGTSEERDMVLWLEDEMAVWSSGVWHPAKAAGLRLHPGRGFGPGLGLQPVCGVFSHGCDGKGR